GGVRDESGCVRAAVAILAKNNETGVVRTAVTDTAGAFQIVSVPAGDYRLEAAAQGFQSAVRNHVTVTVGAAVAVNFDLVLGDVKQEVSVTAEAPQVNTLDASLGGLVGEREVRELPLNGRHWLQLTTTEAGLKRE